MANVITGITSRLAVTWQNFTARMFRIPVKEDDNSTPELDALTPIPFGGPAIYADPNAIRFIQFGYSGNASIYTIISTIARKAAFIPRYVYMISDKQAYKAYHTRMKTLTEFKAFEVIGMQKKAYDENVIDAVPGKPSYAALVQRPNPYQGQDSFFESVFTFRLTAGESFIWLNRGIPTEDPMDINDDAADKLPVYEMYVIPAQYVEIIPDPVDVFGVLGYVFRVGGFRMYMRKNDIIHWRTPNPDFDAYSRQHLRGFSPLNPGNKILTQDESATDAQVALQQSQGAKGVLVNELQTNLTPQQESQLRGVIDRKINSRDLRGSVAMLAGKWAYLNVGQTGQEMELEKTQSSNFVRLCNLFGVPPELFINGSTYQNKLQARKDFLTNLVLPLCSSLNDEMNRSLRRAFGLGEDIVMDVDTSGLAELQDDATRYIQQLAQAWWLSPNERRAAMNEQEITDDPNMDKIWIPNGMQPIDEAAQTDLLNPLMAAGFKQGNNGPAGGIQSNSKPNGAKTSDIPDTYGNP